MNIIQISNNLLLYQFPPEPGKEYGFNIYALISGNEVTLIDSAYQYQAKKVLTHLEKQSLVIKQILLSHTHVDHIEGLKILQNRKVFISEKTLPTDISQLSSNEIHLLENKNEMLFGEFKLKFISAPGHSESSMHIIINETIIHVGDNLIATNEGIPTLPFVYHGRSHLRSLKYLKDLAPQQLILGHGKPIQKKPVIIEEINNRMRYIQAVWDAKGKIPFEEAVIECNTEFRQPGWHSHNVKKAIENGLEKAK